MKFLILHSVIFIIVLLGLQTYSICLAQKSKHHDKHRAVPLSHITGSLEVSLQYCHIKALLLNLTQVSRHCIKRWDHKYNKYCVTSSNHVDRLKCKRLKRKVSKLRNEWINARLRGTHWNRLVETIQTSTHNIGFYQEQGIRSQRNRRLIRCGKVRINQRQNGCCGDKSFELATQGCCGEVIYEKETEGCCSNMVYSTESYGCCYDIAYDLENEACCNMNVHYIDGRQNRLCCGNESIDASFYFCFENRTVVLKQNIGVVIDATQPNNTHSTISGIPSDNLHVTSFLVSAVAATLFMASVVLLWFALKKYIFRKRNRAYVTVNKFDNLTCTMSTLSEAVDTLDPLNDNLNRADRHEYTINSSINQPSAVFLNNKSLSGHKSKSFGEHEHEATVRLDSVNGLMLADEEDEKVGDQDTTVAILKEKDPAVNRMVACVTTYTQTSEEKQLNIRNSMGRSFDVKFVFNQNNRILNIPNSAATLTLSNTDAAADKTCLASTFRSLYEITDKLKLDKDRCVASPAVEYKFINTKLTDFAKVTMPFIGNSANLTVLKVESDQGNNVTVETKVIKRKDDATRDVDDEYYEIIGSGKIAIYVKSLSWLVCTSCNETHPVFNLSGYLYGRLDERQGQLYASLGLYIADDIRNLLDYNQLIKDAEKDRLLVRWRRLPLSAMVNLDDFLRVSLTIDPPNLGWEHRTGPGGDPIQPEEQDIPMQSITACHREVQSGLPFAKDWYLVSRAGPGQEAAYLECILNTAHVSHSTSDVSSSDSNVVLTRLLYDDLARRKSTEEKKERREPHDVMHAVPPEGHIQHPASAHAQIGNANNRQQQNGGHQEVVHGLGFRRGQILPIQQPGQIGEWPLNEGGQGHHPESPNGGGQEGQLAITGRVEPPPRGEESPGNEVRGEMPSQQH